MQWREQMERALQILDYAVLVISGTDGVQSHTETLWHLLLRYNIPTFIFVNKMDITHKSKEELMEDIKINLSSNCVCFQDDNYVEEAYDLSKIMFVLTANYCREWIYLFRKTARKIRI